MYNLIEIFKNIVKKSGISNSVIDYWYNLDLSGSRFSKKNGKSCLEICKSLWETISPIH